MSELERHIPTDSSRDVPDPDWDVPDLDHRDLQGADGENVDSVRTKLLETRQKLRVLGQQLADITKRQLLIRQVRFSFALYLQVVTIGNFVYWAVVF